MEKKGNDFGEFFFNKRFGVFCSTFKFAEVLSVPHEVSFVLSNSLKCIISSSLSP